MEKKTKKIIFRTIGIILLVIILAGGIFLSAFASRDPKFKTSELVETDYFTGAKVIQSLLNRALNAKSDSEIRVLKLNNQEIQSLLRLAENGESLLYLITGRRPSSPETKEVPYKVSYDREVYSVSVKLTDTFCGLCFVGRGRMELEYEDGELDINIISLKVGSTEVPDFVRENVKDGIYQYLKNESAYDAVRAALVKVKYYSDGSADIHYRPYRLRKYFQKSFLGF